jgi:hypothetical protein
MKVREGEEKQSMSTIEYRGEGGVEREEQGVSRRVKRESWREREVGQVKVVRRVPTKREREREREHKSI